jgi:hypothetical protein
MIPCTRRTRRRGRVRVSARGCAVRAMLQSGLSRELARTSMLALAAHHIQWAEPGTEPPALEDFGHTALSPPLRLVRLRQQEGPRQAEFGALGAQAGRQHRWFKTGVASAASGSSAGACAQLRASSTPPHLEEEEEGLAPDLQAAGTQKGAWRCEHLRLGPHGTAALAASSNSAVRTRHCRRVLHSPALRTHLVAGSKCTITCSEREGMRASGCEWLASQAGPRRAGSASSAP